MRAKNDCKRHSMYIDFSTLFGKKNRYLAPKGFDAYRCSGECPFPIPGHMNSSAHAVLQKQMSQVDSKWPSPCCVPTTMKSYRVLFLDSNDVVKQMDMEKMVILGCGCR